MVNVTTPERPVQRFVPGADLRLGDDLGRTTCVDLLRPPHPVTAGS
jgi:hypothetical protein